jgi:hypothetical protein
MARKDERSTTAVIETGDTLALNVRVGGRVRCISGKLKGVEGVVTATRTGGRALIRLAAGVYLELPRVCLERVE